MAVELESRQNRQFRLSRHPPLERWLQSHSTAFRVSNNLSALLWHPGCLAGRLESPECFDSVFYSSQFPLENTQCQSSSDNSDHPAASRMVDSLIRAH